MAKLKHEDTPNPSATQAPQGPEALFVRLAHAQAPYSHLWVVEGVTVQGGRVVERRELSAPDVLALTECRLLTESAETERRRRG
jgi:hypothetical protein